MSVIYFNRDWTFKEVVENIEVIKIQVWGVITSFSYGDIKKEIIFKQKLRDHIYSLNFENWKCDRILEYIYNDIDLELLKKLAER